MRRRSIDARRRGEEGAVSILIAALSLALFMFAALAVDISKQVDYKHGLQNQLDAAAVAAGYYMDNKATGCDSTQPSKTCLATAVAKAQDYYKRNYDQTLDLHNVEFWCVVARRQTTTTPATPTSPGQAALYQIATTSYGSGVCNPDAVSGDSGCASGNNCFKLPNYANETRAWDSARFSMTCSAAICAIPCGLKASPANSWNPGTSSLNSKAITCNTIRIVSERGVPFHFGPSGGIANGSTGQQVSVACKGSCGAIAVNPMDVVVVADRTPSMSPTDRHAMVDGIRSMLTKMTPQQQFLSIGTIARSMTTNRGTSNCPSSYNNSNGSISGSGGLTFPSTNVNSGQWVPLKFYNDYLTSTGALDGNSTIGKALTCIYNGNSYDGGTSLAAPLKAAARYLLGYDANNIQNELNGSSRVGQVRKVIIFETDGAPQEWGSTSTATSLTSTSDPMSRYGEATTTNNNGSSNKFDEDVSRGSYRNGNTYTLYNNKLVKTTDTSNTSTFYGGQQACKQFQTVAANAKAAGILIITIGYNLSDDLCSVNNAPDGYSGYRIGSGYDGTSTEDGASWISDIQPHSGAWGNTSGQRKSDCVDGSGTQDDPYSVRTSKCKRSLDVTTTYLKTITGTKYVQRTDDQSVTDVLASVAGATGIASSTSNGCANDALRAAENSDGDYFFCSASGDDMTAIFQTALSQVTTGVKLLSALPR